MIMININSVLPLLVIFESLGASVFYIVNKQYGSSLYWFFAACINISVLWIPKLG